jgi:hypothetical protein
MMILSQYHIFELDTINIYSVWNARVIGKKLEQEQSDISMIYIIRIFGF